MRPHHTSNARLVWALHFLGQPMSLCRFSSDDYRCELYCYQQVHGGYMIHVASNRVIFNRDLPPKVPFDPDHLAEYTARENTVRAMVMSADRVPIGLPHDGKHIVCEDEASLLGNLIMLKHAGYRFPDGVIEVLRENASKEVAHG